MDAIVSATEANRRFSELLRKVAAGETVTIVSRGHPVARMAPVEPQQTMESRKRLTKYLEKLSATDPIPWKRKDLYD